jgi:hypothetical protein
MQKNTAPETSRGGGNSGKLNSSPGKLSRPPEQEQIICLEWRPLDRNTLRGFAHIRVAWQLDINGLAVHQNGKRWAQLPARQQLDNAGDLVKDGERIRYATVLQFSDRHIADRFSDAVVHAVEQKIGGAL